MIKKGTKLYSILFNKCPKCHEGNFLKEKNILKIHKAFDLHKNCSVCGLKYMIEPSFFYGAMYVNYALTTGIAIITFVIASYFFYLSLVECFIPIVVILILTLPFTLRLSRIIWINIFVKYRPLTEKHPEND